jgi:hypothetical protein
MKIQTAGDSTGVIELSLPVAASPTAALPAESDVLVTHRIQNARTWEVLERLGVREGTELALDFSFASAGPDADRELAGYLRQLGYKAEIEPGEVRGRTHPMLVGLDALDSWVASMIAVSYTFEGWTATVRRP